MQMDDFFDRLAVFQTDAGITVAFGERTYFIGLDEPFYNIAKKEQGTDLNVTKQQLVTGRDNEDTSNFVTEQNLG